VDRSSTGHILGDVPLFLAASNKSVEMAPNGISIGAIKLLGWQLHRLSPLSPDFAGHAAYLIRANYEFDIAADVPAPAFAEIEFAFPDADVSVVDAIPRGVINPTAATVYQLTEQLNFVHRNGDAGRWWPAGSAADSIAMPAVVPQIDCFGLGGALVRWRHSATVPAGTRTGWFVLVVPPGWRTIRVLASGRYHVETDAALRLRPASRRDAFDVRLPAAVPAQPPPPAFLDTDASCHQDGPRIFVSYAWESEAHKVAVKEFCSLLGEQGVDVRFDQQDVGTRRNWGEWTTTQIQRADYVVVIASPAYRSAGEGGLSSDQHRGVQSEYDRLADLLLRKRQEWTRKILPVVLPGRSVDDIPLSFLPGIADHYLVSSLTRAGVADVLEVILNGR
jgi:hypothetical protein